MNIKKLLFSVLFLFSAASFIFADALSMQVMEVGSNGNYLQATTTDNPVFHASIETDSQGDTITSISVGNFKDSWYIGAATEPDSIKANSVKLWYYPADRQEFNAATAQYVTHLPVDADYSNWWHDNSFSLPVENGSGIWITIDIPESPSPGSAEFQADEITFNSGASINISGQPSNPPVMLVTEVKPAELLEVSHTGGGMQTFVSTGQQNIIPMNLSFFNASGEGAASVIMDAITLTAKSYDPFGNTLSPSSIINSIKIQDKNTGTIYGQLDSASLPSSPRPMEIPLSLVNIPSGTTTTANIILEMTENTASAGANFIISLENHESISAFDYYTYEKTTVQSSPADPTGFEMVSNFSTLKKQAVEASAQISDSLPQTINKGQQNVELLSAVFENPGDVDTASVEFHQITINLSDDNGDPVVPGQLFSKVSITDPSGAVIYASKDSSSLENSGGAIFFPLLNTIHVAAGSTAAVVVRADINASTAYNNFKVSVSGPDDMPARDVNSFAPVQVTITTDSPFVSKLALLSSTFRVAGDGKIPSNIYKGSSDIHIMDIILSSPLAFGDENSLLARGITLTALDQNSMEINFDTAASSIKSVSASGESFHPAAADTQLYIAFPEDVTIPTSGSTAVSLYADIKDDTSADAVVFSLQSSAHIDAYESNDPLRQVFAVPDAGYSFPMLSGTGHIKGSAGGLNFRTYPNPFMRGSSASIAYYLDTPGKTTIEVFDIMGNRLRTIIKDEYRQAGAHESDSWDGRDENGRYLTAGTYLIRIKTETSDSVRKITFIK
ncbi:MAG: FlgD immunoglobulin-like domain containing protein [bacterium]